MQPFKPPQKPAVFPMLAAAGILCALYLLMHPPAPAAPPAALVSFQAPIFENAVKNADGKTTLLYIYASWCPYCKKQYPILEQLLESKKETVNILAISKDRDVEKLSNFLQQNPPFFTPYIITSAEFEKLEAALIARGAKYSGNFPYIAVFNASGKLTAQFYGLTPAANIQAALPAGNAVTK